MNKRYLLFSAFLIGFILSFSLTSMAAESNQAKGHSDYISLHYVPSSAENTALVFADIFTDVEITEDDDSQNGQDNSTAFLTAQCVYNIPDRVLFLIRPFGSSGTDPLLSNGLPLFILQHSWKSDLA